MKRSFLLLFLSFVMLGATYVASAQTQGELQFRPGQQRTFAAAKLKVKFISVLEDSRCPADTNCVWAGNAKIKIEVTDMDSGEKKTMEINTTTGATGDTIGRHSVRLTSLTPTKRSNKPIKAKDYRATISVGRLKR